MQGSSRCDKKCVKRKLNSLKSLKETKRQQISTTWIMWTNCSRTSNWIDSDLIFYNSYNEERLRDLCDEPEGIAAGSGPEENIENSKDSKVWSSC